MEKLWYFTRYEPVTNETFVPWKDGEYSTIIHFEPLVLEFKKIFSEEFKGWRSTKIKGLAEVRLNASVVALKPTEARDYLKGILSELGDELDVKARYKDKEVNLRTFLQGKVGEFDKELQKIRLSPESAQGIQIPQTSRVTGGEIVGPRIDTPVLNYAPLNELGVVLLFGVFAVFMDFMEVDVTYVTL